ncbi:5-hydroxytryptamine receptor 3B-like [Salarias fasciatus]|uniref:5-hydroxytryptamine receptor 3B-like n=1 Tax=Salarias fasciatus TaxID=181472 RepID=UPI001176D9AE|nr:5-hydroxytryptamine receptor 3B-like [Salarias fasciatus]
MLVGYFILLLLTDNVTEHEGNCSYQAVLDYLNLTKNKELFTMSRPVKHFRNDTKVYFEMLISSILDVVSFYFWTDTYWLNDYISWDRNDFCGLEILNIPTESLWKPDLIINEIVEKDKNPESPYLQIDHEGYVDYWNDQMVVSSCKMHVYRFPFDIQKCNLSFRSLIHRDKALSLNFIDNDDRWITHLSRRLMHTQSEWLFLKLTSAKTTENIYIGHNQTILFYTIHVKRRSVLYIANFLVPVLFFFCLDLSSFLISDSGGEKLSFKVTVMLAVTVMQLILNEILPSSSDRIPLIALFCIGMFGLMMLSLLETIFVMYLMEKDAASQNNETNSDLSLNRSKQKVKKCGNCASISDVSTNQTPNTKEDSSSQLMEVSFTLEKVSEELQQIENTMTAMEGEKEEKIPGYWTAVAKQINKVFIVFYVISAIVSSAVTYDRATLLELRFPFNHPVNGKFHNPPPPLLSSIPAFLSRPACRRPGSKRRRRRGRRGGLHVKLRSYLKLPWTSELIGPACAVPSRARECYRWLLPVGPDSAISTPNWCWWEKSSPRPCPGKPPPDYSYDSAACRLVLAPHGFCNARSINKKTFVFNDIISSRNLDFFFLVETWLPPGDVSLFSELLPSGYLFLNSPRQTGRAGGDSHRIQAVLELPPTVHQGVLQL